MNVLYITYDGLSDPLGQSQIIPYLKGLSQQGHDITIISCEKKERLSKQEVALRNELKSIEWHPVIFLKKPPVVSTLINLGRLRKAAKEVTAKKQVQVIHCRSTLASLTGLWLKSRTGARLIFDMRGFWADERVEGRLWPQSNPLYRFIYGYVKRKEDELLIASDHIITLTHAASEIIRKKNLNGIAPVSVIPCCADEEFFINDYSPSFIEEERNKLGIGKEETVIIYTGSTGTWYMLDEMLHFFKCMLEDDPKSKFLYITKENPDLIFQAARNAGITEQSLIIRSAERKEIPLYLSLADFSLFFIRPGYSKKASSPVKLGESMMAGLPVITNAGIGDDDEIISGKAGWIIKDFNEESYRAVISAMKVQAFGKEQIRKTALDYFSLKSGIEKYAAVYASLIQ